MPLLMRGTWRLVSCCRVADLRDLTAVSPVITARAGLVSNAWSCPVRATANTVSPAVRSRGGPLTAQGAGPRVQEHERSTRSPFTEASLTRHRIHPFERAVQQLSAYSQT